jgi:bla regulator protein blaR1
MIEPPARPPRKSRRIFLAAAAALSGLAALIHLPAVAAERASYVLFAQGSQSTTMSGSTDDLKRAKAARVGGEALLYVRQGGASYVIRDPATLRRARLIFQPQEALGARQAELGSRQAGLGSRQAALGAEQARLGAQQAGASPGRAAELGRRQEALGRQQDELGKQQDALGRQQGALGREQGRLASEAEAKFRALLADALKRGLARRMN